MIIRTTPPPVKIPEKLPEINPEKSLLDNGNELYVFTDRTIEVAKIDLIYEYGTVDFENPLVAKAAFNLLLNGTKDYSADEISETLDTYGAFIEKEISLENVCISIYAPTYQLEKLLDFLTKIFKQATYPERELQLYIDRNIERLKTAAQKVEYLAKVAFRKQLFGKDNPYAFSPVADDYKKLTRKELVGFYEQNIKSSKLKIIASGNLPDAALNKINKTFGQDKTNNHLLTNKPTDFRYEAGQQYIEKKDAVQAAIRIGLSWVNRLDKNYPAMQLLNTILGGYFGSRLMSNIREDKGYTYGIGSGVMHTKQKSFCYIATEVGKKYKDAAVKEIYKEINVLKDKLVDDEELNLVKNYIAGDLLKSFDGIFEIAGIFKVILLHQLPMDYYLRFLKEVKEVKNEAIRALAKEYFEGETIAETIVG